MLIQDCEIFLQTFCSVCDRIDVFETEGSRYMMDKKDAYIQQLEQTIVTLNKTIQGMEQQIQNLTEMIQLLRKEKFGSSSEKHQSR